MLGYLDCRLMVLGTRLYMAKTKVRSELTYASHLAAVKTDKMKVTVKDKTDKVKSDIKDGIDKVKTKVNEKKSSKEETKTEETVEVEEVNVEETEEIEKVSTMKVNVEPTHTSTIEPEPVVQGPDFSLLQGVYYDPDTDNFNIANNSENNPNVMFMQSGDTVIVGSLDNENLSESQGREVTQEDIDIALKKMKENQQPNDKKSKGKK